MNIDCEGIVDNENGQLWLMGVPTHHNKMSHFVTFQALDYIKQSNRTINVIVRTISLPDRPLFCFTYDFILSQRIKSGANHKRLPRTVFLAFHTPHARRPRAPGNVSRSARFSLPNPCRCPYPILFFPASIDHPWSWFTL